MEHANKYNLKKNTYIHTHIHMSHVVHMSTVKNGKLHTTNILQTTNPLVAETEGSTPLTAEPATGYIVRPSNVFYILLKKTP
jgi:hypothetical protein